MPACKSFADPLILFYLNSFYNIDLGFSFGSHADVPSIPSIHRLLRRIGHFMIRRKELTEDLCLSYVSQALMEEVIDNNTVTTVFLNDQRSRCGKLCVPSQAEASVRQILKSYLALQKFRYDIKIVPVSIDYDRTPDSTIFSGDGRPGSLKPGANMVNIMQKTFMSRRNLLGKCMIKHCDPIDLDAYINAFLQAQGQVLDEE